MSLSAWVLTGVAILLAAALDFLLIRHAHRYSQTLNEAQQESGVAGEGESGFATLTWIRYKLRPFATLIRRIVLWAHRQTALAVWIGGGLIAASFGWQTIARGPNLLSWICLATGLALVIASRPAWPERGTEAVAAPQETSASAFRIRPSAFILPPAGLILSFLAWLASGTRVKMPSPGLAISAWMAGMTLALAGGLDWPIHLTKVRTWLSTRVVQVTLLVVLVAGIVRFTQLSSLPAVLNGDEGGLALYAQEILAGRVDNPFISGWYSFPSLYSFLEAPAIAYFGHTLFAVRLLSALIGALTVGAVYWFGQLLFGNRTALFAALFLAVFHFHNHFSRIGLQNIWDAWWFTLVLGWIWVGWQKESRLAFVLSGLALGLAQYFYIGARILIPVALAWITLLALQDLPGLKRRLPSLGAFALAAVTAALPLALFYLRYPADFMAPIVRVAHNSAWLARTVKTTGLMPWQIWAQQLMLSFEGYAHLAGYTFYNGEVPILLPAAAALFFTGLGALLAQPHDARAGLLVLWLIAFGITGALSSGAPAPQRFVATAPALAIVVGYGLDVLGRNLPRRRWVSAVPLLLLALLCAGELHFYFFNYAPRSAGMGGNNTLVAQRLAEQLQGKSSQWEVLFLGAPYMGYHSIKSLPFLAPPIHFANADYPWGSTKNPQPQAERVIFVVLPHREDDLARVQRAYPGGTLQTEVHNGKILFWSYALERLPGSE